MEIDNSPVYCQCVLFNHCVVFFSFVTVGRSFEQFHTNLRFSR